MYADIIFGSCRRCQPHSLPDTLSCMVRAAYACRTCSGGPCHIDFHIIVFFQLCFHIVGDLQRKDFFFQPIMACPCAHIIMARVKGYDHRRCLRPSAILGCRSLRCPCPCFFRRRRSCRCCRCLRKRRLKGLFPADLPILVNRDYRYSCFRRFFWNGRSLSFLSLYDRPSRRISFIFLVHAKLGDCLQIGQEELSLLSVLDKTDAGRFIAPAFGLRELL